jgi:maleylpyruvate isomerase
VVAHVARNADALVNLVTWARTGVQTPMYADRAQRANDIERGAAQPADALKADLVRSDARFAAACAELPKEAWEAPVRTASGRQVPAREVMWMRTREVWVHAVDLNVGIGLETFPGGLVDALLDDASATMSPRMTESVRLEPSDRDRSWLFGPAQASPVVVGGRAADLLGYAIGRASGERSGRRPSLPPWL